MRQQTSPALSSPRTGGRVDPLGMPGTPPRLSWSVAPDARIDPGTFFEVSVAASERALRDGPLLWSGGGERPWVGYGGPEPASRQRLYWTVTALDRSGLRLTGDVASWEVGLTSAADWRAGWIRAEPVAFPRESWDPCPYLRREFDVEDMGSVRVYASALGLYRLWLNGVELTSGELYRPGWTDYAVRVHHQTFDGTAALRRGRNTLTAVLAKGWYAGRLGLLREPGYYGDRPAFLAQLEVDGVPVVGTDEEWRTGHGALLASDLLRGEIQDLRQEPEGWHLNGFDDSGWAPALPFTAAPELVLPQPHDSITGYRTHPGKLVHAHARGPAVFDFGQNLVGWTRLTTPCAPSVELIVRHGEILTPDRLVYRDNLRGAFQEDHYTVPDPGPHRLETSFTMHGFRYAEVWGLPGTTPYGAYDVLPETSIEACSVTGLPSRTGWFECSDDRLTRLASNVEWTVRDNFLEAVTDCPQRDERHGWLGDAGVIAPTAAYHFDVSAFVAKFAQDAADTQDAEGIIRNYAPAVPPSTLRPGAPGWSDGFVRLVHLLVQRYGELETARRLFEPMTRFLGHVDRANPDGLRVNQTGADFGDWLSLPERDGLPRHTGFEYTGAYSTTPRPIVGTAHSYRSFVQLSEIARRLGEDGEAARLAARAERIREAYLEAFLLPDGDIKEATQTAYAQAVGYGLVRGEAARATADRLRENIERIGHVTAGIHGVEHVLPVLSAYGHADFATGLLLRDRMPGWLYMVGQGATTIWEKWDGIEPDGSLATAEMNSFNHCALGAVGRHLFEGVAGIDATETTWTGEVAVRARYTRELDWVRAGYDSPVGPIRSHWRWSGEVVEHELEVPGAAYATVHAPVGAALEAEDATPSPTATPAATPAVTTTGHVRLGPGRHTVRVHLGPR
ncbi:family 78 glycoside hydrolase catalytic domain [Streptosporangium sp. NPDC000563]|uniref:family 78 glycoside hydrolase catalytic domain n=1 Tax=Streptosporangium sp. NPDC000563 TaxID=3154366 RepID=UPI003331E5B4